MRTRLLAVALTVLALDARALDVVLEHPHGELVDVGATSARVSAGAAHWFDCNAPVEVRTVERTVRVTIRHAAYGGPVPDCGIRTTATLGVLAAGWWRFEFAVLGADGVTAVDGATIERKVGRPESMCNEYPGPTARVVAEHGTLSGPQFMDRYEQSPAFRDLLGHPIEVRPFVAFPDVLLGYPTLENPHDLRARLLATGEFRDVWADGPVCLATPPPDAMAEMIEYYHAGLDHYFYTFDPSEIAILDEGVRIRGWARTGETFRILASPGCPLHVPERVAYRFYGTPGVGPSTHVFTVDREECRSVDRTRLWTYEGVAFWAVPIDARGGCAAGMAPLYRVWRPFEVTNHRFTTRRATVEAMRARGWIEEGTVMCLRPQ